MFTTMMKQLTNPDHFSFLNQPNRQDFIFLSLVLPDLIRIHFRSLNMFTLHKLAACNYINIVYMGVLLEDSLSVRVLYAFKKVHDRKEGGFVHFLQDRDLLQKCPQLLLFLLGNQETDFLTVIF